MKEVVIVLSVLALIISSYGQKTKKQPNVANNEEVSQTEPLTEISQTTASEFKILQLEFGFKVTAVLIEEFFPTFKLYEHFKLERNGNIIFSDSLLEFEFCDKLFPIVLQTGNNCFELLFEVNNRPFKNYLKRFFITNNKLVGQDKLPTFEAKPLDINNDGIKEYAGFWYSSEVWGENDDITAYNPILYYSVTKNGLKLDSLLTKQRNEMIYGQFYEFSYNENEEQPISIFKKFEQELKLIRNER